MKKKCIVCGKEFECYDKTKLKGKHSGKKKKPFRSVCCGKKCSMIYQHSELNKEQIKWE